MMTLPIWVFVLLTVLAVPGLLMLAIFAFWAVITINLWIADRAYKEEAEKASKCPDFIEAPEERKGN